MLVKTLGIYLNHIKYSENNIIARIYTEQFGIKSFLLKKGQGKKSAVKANTLHPLSRMEMVVSGKEKNNIYYIKELKALNPCTNIPGNVVNGTIALFLSEVLYKCIKEEEQNIHLFDFLDKSLLILEDSENILPDFHLKFLISLASYLGFGIPEPEKEKSRCFDLKEGFFSQQEPGHHFFVPENLLQDFISLKGPMKESLPLTSEKRRQLLGHILNYYGLHLEKMGEIKSHKVLETIMC
jgi:DNA repair protein RecO (recombination protein O)